METELKFQVPRGQRGLLHRAVLQAGGRSTRLQAVYADTAGQHLAAAGMALRLRKEGRVWVQTLKGRGDGLASRFEHEVALRGVRGLPDIDASLHDGTALAPALSAALRLGGALLPVYRTDIQRLHVRLRFQRAVVEVALDRGHLMAGDETTGESRAPVHEIEFELVSGPPTALPALAEQWALRHGLWWDVRTKSERGFKLAHQVHRWPVSNAALTSATVAQVDGAPGAALSATLAQVLTLAAVVADGLCAAADVRRLQRVLRSLAAVVQPAHAELAAGVQGLELGLQRHHHAAAFACGPVFTATLLRVLALAMGQAKAQPQP